MTEPELPLELGPPLEPGPPLDPGERDWWHEGWYVLIGSALSIGIIGLAAWATHEPWVFPSLGPTAYILLVAPLSLEACPRTVVVAHLIGILSGLLAVTVFGLFGQGPDLPELTLQRVGAVTMALALTFAVMTWLRVPHPPAGATALIVSLGLLNTLMDYAVMMLAVVALVVITWIINRVHGTRPPVWGPVKDPRN
jgi:CBS domain-containing membrane protein